MADKKTTPIVIDGVEYQYEDLTAEQRLLFNHCLDLDQKISSAQFNLDQLNVGKNAFFGLLKNSLLAPKAATESEGQSREAASVEATVQ